MASLERRWKKERQRHEDQVQPWRFFAGRGQRRTATITPARLRYWSYAPPRPWIFALAVVVVAGFLGYQTFIDETPATASDVVRFLVITALVLLLAITRITVSNFGLSFDIAGLRRVSCFGFIALSAVLDVTAGTRPADWPRGRSASSWFPGSHAVHVLYLLDGDRAVRSLWVRQPDRFGEALLGRPLRDRTGQAD
ncbi:MAG: hypothetical protein H0V64_03730 [Geodermatophilaceae bacterium]|nr:hypothetical protein [Geodermatophilaceae bacterium]MDQ3464581.1 hypothetical protein [Actinomycetota bacterium]